MKMGQGESSTSADPGAAQTPLSNLQEKVAKHAIDIKHAATMPYATFLETLQELNKITHNFGEIGGKTLVFQVKKGSDSSVWWRGTVRIKCHKVFSHNGTIESSRVLNLKQYIRLYKEIKAQAAMGTVQVDQPPTPLCASMILTQMDSVEVADSEECCICMDRVAVVILPCSHIYCEQCIDQWSFDHKTCPICRAKVQGADDTWVLTEKPDKSQMAYEATGYLLGLADKTGAPVERNGED